MRKLLFLLFILPFFISCNKQPSEKGDVTLTLLNDSVTYIVPREWENEINLWYENDAEKDSAYNVIRYKLTNNTNKKLLFLMKDINLIDIEPILLNIKEEGVLKSGIDVLSHPAGMSHEDMVAALKEESPHQKYMKQQVVINPGESREFEALLPLPFIMSKPTSSYYYEFYPNLNYTFSLDYSIGMKGLNEVLPKGEKENLKRNNIEIFDGKLTSNEIKLVRKDTW